MFDIKKRDNESFIEYADRLIDAKENGIIDLDKSEIWEFLFGEKISPDESRKRLYGVKTIISKLKEEGYKNITEEDILKQLEIKKQELQKEKYKVQTEKIALNQMLREEARFELFIERAIEEIKKHPILDINKNLRNKNVVQQNNKCGLLAFADLHYNKEFKILGLHGEIINEYSVDVFKKRMWKLLDKTIEIVDKEGFNEISVFNLGDELEGIIRISQLMTLKYGLVESAIQFAYFIADWLNELSKYVLVDYYVTEGNHTELRLLTGKKGDIPDENLSKVIHVLISEILKENSNIILHENYTDKIYTNIAGFNVLGIHGEEKNVMQAIRDFSFIYNTQIDYMVTGHKHHANSINAGVRKGCIGVGSIMGIDDFAMDIKRVSNPTSTFAIFEEGVGKTVEYTIYLD